MTSALDRRKYFPEDIWESLKNYADKERCNVSEALRGSITPESIAWEVLRIHLQKTGHYPPKGEVPL
jgi:hypothetical protein